MPNNTTTMICFSVTMNNFPAGQSLCSHHDWLKRTYQSDTAKQHSKIIPKQHNKMNYFENKNEELSHEKTTVATMVSTLPSNQPSP